MAKKWGEGLWGEGTLEGGKELGRHGHGLKDFLGTTRKALIELFLMHRDVERVGSRYTQAVLEQTQLDAFRI